MQQSGAPGTVSKILWHFTGGPRWNTEEKCQEVAPKPVGEAFDALCGILRTKELRLGSYREAVSVEVPIARRDPATGNRLPNYKIVYRESAPVCCVADIPIAHLSYHASRYGKIAIGFHRDAVVSAGFNPVFYTLQHSPVLRSLHRGFGELETIDIDTVLLISRDCIESGLKDAQCDFGHPVRLSDSITSKVASNISVISDVATAADERLKHFLAFVKTFALDEFSTIYCEREWRSTKTFSFKLEDIAMIVLPKTGGTNFFGQFVEAVDPPLGLPRTVPIVPWEDLVEH